jgi:arginyl-tRNA synthetase
VQDKRNILKWFSRQQNWWNLCFSPFLSLEHVPFGLVRREDGEKTATQSVDTVKLKDLLEEAMRVAGEDITSQFVMDHDSTMEQSNDVTKEI